MIPARLGSRRFLIKAAILPGKGRRTPVLLSKELLRDMGAVMNMARDEIYFKKYDVTVLMSETDRGHYAILFFEFDDHECFVSGVQNMNGNHGYDIQALEKQDRSSKTVDQEVVSDGGQQRHDRAREPADPSHDGQCDDRRRVPTEASDESKVGRVPRSGCGRTGSAGTRRHCTHGGQVLQAGQSTQLSGDVLPRQGLCSLGTKSYSREECGDNAAVPDLHPPSRSGQEESHSGRAGRHWHNGCATGVHGSDGSPSVYNSQMGSPN